jgi:hypothetical protein
MTVQMFTRQTRIGPVSYHPQMSNPLSLTLMMMHWTATRSWIRSQFSSLFGQVRRVHLLLKSILKGVAFIVVIQVGATSSLCTLHLERLQVYNFSSHCYADSKPTTGDPGGNSASAEFAHCRRSQRVPHLDRAWTHQISFFNCPLVF